MIFLGFKGLISEFFGAGKFGKYFFSMKHQFSQIQWSWEKYLIRMEEFYNQHSNEPYITFILGKYDSYIDISLRQKLTTGNAQYSK